MGSGAVEDRLVRRLVILLLALTVSVTSDVAASAQVPTTQLGQRGPDRRGLVFDGLSRHDRSGLCQGNYELAHRDRVSGALQVLCTHGPDPAPEGVDVRERRAPDAAATLTPTAGVAAASTGIQCYGNGTDGYRVQLIYARASNVADRFAQYQASFVQWAANLDLMLDASAAETGGSRHVRYVTDASCNLVIDRVTLSTSGDDNLSNTISELRARGYTRTDRKYLVWTDANVYCGIAQVYYDDRATATPGANYNNGHTQVQGTVARVDNGCWGLANSVEAHELMHNLGGVQSSAPHATANSHCKDEYDRMCYVDAAGVQMTYVCASTHENRFDCNHDDYFHTAPPAGNYLATHWNTASSAFLSSVPGGTPTSTTTTTPTTAPPSTTTTTKPTTTTTVPPATTTTTRPPTTTTTPTTVPPTGARPSAPRNLVVMPAGGGAVNLSWQAPLTGPVTGYRIYQGTGFGTPVLVATVGNVLSSTRTGVPLGLMSYYVTASNAAGESVASNRVYVIVR